MRGIPSNSVYDKYIFLRNAKYNIGGHIFSLIEVAALCNGAIDVILD